MHKGAQDEEDKDVEEYKDIEAGEDVEGKYTEIEARKDMEEYAAIKTNPIIEALNNSSSSFSKKL